MCVWDLAYQLLLNACVRPMSLVWPCTIVCVCIVYVIVRPCRFNTIEDLCVVNVFGMTMYCCMCMYCMCDCETLQIHFYWRLVCGQFFWFDHALMHAHVLYMWLWEFDNVLTYVHVLYMWLWEFHNVLTYVHVLYMWLWEFDNVLMHVHVLHMWLWEFDNVLTYVHVLYMWLWEFDNVRTYVYVLYMCLWDFADIILLKTCMWSIFLFDPAILCAHTLGKCA